MVFRLTQEQYEGIRSRAIRLDDRTGAWSRAAGVAQAIAQTPEYAHWFRVGEDLGPMIKAILEHQMEA